MEPIVTEKTSKTYPKEPQLTPCITANGEDSVYFVFVVEWIFFMLKIYLLALLAVFIPIFANSMFLCAFCIPPLLCMLQTTRKWDATYLIPYLIWKGLTLAAEALILVVSVFALVYYHRSESSLKEEKAAQKQLFSLAVFEFICVFVGFWFFMFIYRYWIFIKKNKENFYHFPPSHRSKLSSVYFAEYHNSVYTV